MTLFESFWLYLLVVCAFTIRILLRRDLTPPGRLAWIMVIIILPFVGGVVYFLFGEPRFGRKAQKKRQQISVETIEKGSDWTGDSGSLSNIPRTHHSTALYASSINGFAPISGNQATLMKDENTTIQQIIKDIESASSHVHVLFYIWLTDNNGTAVAKALIQASKRGVKCRVMVDGLGSGKFIRSKLWKQLKRAGVKTQVAQSLANPVKSALLSRIDLRNHQKIVVIDNKITYCGSQNCADPEFRIQKKYAPWIDIMVRLTGPIVAQNQLLFATDWLYYYPKDSVESFLDPKPRSHGDGFPAQVAADGPTIRRGASSQLFMSLIASAKKTLVISTPYFVPNNEIVASLTTAALRGVQVQLIFPARNNSWIVRAASRSHYLTLLESGIEIYEFTPGLLHSKTLTVDGEVSLIGSSNLDIRSFDLNFENNIILYDSQITSEIQKRQDEYLSQSNKVHLKTVQSWSFIRRMWHNTIATIGPVL